MCEFLLKFVEEGQHILDGNHRAVDADAFAEIDEVGRGEKSGLIAKFLKIRRQERRNGTLPVGAGHVHAAQFPLGVTDDVEQSFYVFQSLFIRRRADFMVHRIGGEYAVQYLLVRFHRVWFNV